MVPEHTDDPAASATPRESNARKGCDWGISARAGEPKTLEGVKVRPSRDARGRGGPARSRARALWSATTEANTVSNPSPNQGAARRGGEFDRSAQWSKGSCPGGEGAGGALAPRRAAAIASGSVTAPVMHSRPPHRAHVSTSKAKTRASSLAQAMRLGRSSSPWSSGDHGFPSGVNSASCLSSSGSGSGTTRLLR